MPITQKITNKNPTEQVVPQAIVFVFMAVLTVHGVTNGSNISQNGKLFSAALLISQALSNAASFHKSSVAKVAGFVGSVGT
jgi:hypothetical protein